MAYLTKLISGIALSTSFAVMCDADKFSDIVTATAPGGAQASVESCDPDGRQSLTDPNLCLDSYCAGATPMKCVSDGNGYFQPEQPETDTDLSSHDYDIGVDNYGNRVQLIDRRKSVEIRVITRENLRFALFSSKEYDVYKVRAANGIKIDLLASRIDVPQSELDGETILIDKIFVSEKLSALLAKMSTRSASKIAGICRFVSSPENVASVIDSALSSVRGKDEFDDLYYYWNDRPMIPVNNLSNIGQACWSIARDYR